MPPTSPRRPTSRTPREPVYQAVPNPTTPDLNTSPDPNTFGSPTNSSSDLFTRRRSDLMPAPSLLSRDSTHESLLAPGTPGTISRNSWGSNLGLAAGAAGISGADNGRRPAQTRSASGLAHSTLGWNNTANDRASDSLVDAQGRPASAARGAAINEKPRWAQPVYPAPRRSRKWLWITLAVAGGVVIVGLAVGLGVGLTRGKTHHSSSSGAAVDDNGSSSSSASTASGTATSSAPSATATTGGQGSLITLADGTTMTYENSFGGYWVWDEADPFNNGAKANSWTPALNESWNWGVDKMYGVNLGGWLVTEPFIVSSLYETYSNGTAGTTVDEYTLSINLGDNLTAVMTDHYDTFITERDFAEIASAGLNWVRIPIPFWAIETWEGEPYLEGVAWQYVLKAIQWARKYGIRINLDFHALPGSQNGWNHSGHVGSINWLNGVMGLANAQRALDYIRTLAQFISQPEYSPVIQNFGFINEPNAGQVSQHIVGTFYNEAYTIIRDITGIGEGNGPYLSVHDGFLGIQKWYGFLTGADRLALDQHPYMIFGNQPTGTLTSISHTPCQWWAASTNTTSATYGVNNAGEWSAATNDCGLWVNAVGSGSRYDGTYEGYTGPTPGTCDYWNDYTQWNQSTINDLNHFVKASMDALQNYFFWTWKIGNSTGTITEVNPFWHYRLGLAHGWIPTDPREAIGTCVEDGVADAGDFNGTFSAAYMTGGAGAGTIAADQASSYAWPPPSFTNVASSDMSLLPQYTQTKAPITLSGPTFTSPGASATIDAGNGWANPSADARQAYTAISGCSYPPEYSAANLTPTAGACGADLTQPTKRNAIPAAPTPAPARQ